MAWRSGFGRTLYRIVIRLLRFRAFVELLVISLLGPLSTNKVLLWETRAVQGSLGQLQMTIGDSDGFKEDCDRLSIFL